MINDSSVNFLWVDFEGKLFGGSESSVHAVGQLGGQWNLQMKIWFRGLSYPPMEIVCKRYVSKRRMILRLKVRTYSTYLQYRKVKAKCPFWLDKYL